jgi:hypothetical protein
MVTKDRIRSGFPRELFSGLPTRLGGQEALMRHALIALAATLLAVSASEAADGVPAQAEGAPVATAPAADASAVQGAATQSAAAAGAAVPGPAAKAEEAASSTVLKAPTVQPTEFKPPSGYRASKQGMETVYCTTYTPIGSRMPEKICMSREQLEEVERRSEMARRDVMKNAKVGGTSGN